MTITADLTKEQELALQQHAERRGVDLDAAVRDIVDSALGTANAAAGSPIFQRRLGVDTGCIVYMADDFDHDLPDSFWSAED
jgi:hypothetical protein